MKAEKKCIIFVLVTLMALAISDCSPGVPTDDKDEEKIMGYCFDAAFDPIRNRLFVAAGNVGMHVFNVSQGKMDFVTTVYDEGYYRNLKLSGNRAYVADAERGLVVFDIAQTIPVVTWKQGECKGYGIYIQSNLAFLAASQTGLYIFDISTPDSPRLISQRPTSGDAWDVWVSEKYAYVADLDKGISVIDVSSPAVPRKVALVTWDRSPSAEIVRGEGNFIYVAAGSRGLIVINIADPLQPEVVGKFKSGPEGFGEGLCVKDRLVYLANGHEENIEENGLFIIDAHRPDSLAVKGKCTFSDWVEGVCLAGNYAFVTNTFSGVRSIDVSNPEKPRLVDSFGSEKK